MAVRVAGCDLGQASASFVVAEVAEDGGLTQVETQYVLHDGRPFESFRKWYAEQGISDCVALGATGIYAEELTAPVGVYPEDACQEAALEREVGDGPFNLVSVGARGYSVLARRPGTGPGGVATYQFLENDKCSSGTGENIGRMATRFGFTLAEADRLALSAAVSIPITARCSVFAKSEMTHFANQGRSKADLFRGFFDSVARNTFALLARNRAEGGPVMLIGGCSRLEAFRRGFEELLSFPLEVPEEPLCFEALGATALAAADLARASGKARALPAQPDAIISVRKKRFELLQPASNWRDRVIIVEPRPVAAEWESKPVVLGLDLGSTGAKAVLTDVETGEAVLDVYDRTEGNPVDASRRLITSILEQCSPDVRAVGVTGSGREAVATLLRAVYPDTDRLVVLNEIVAHARAAVRVDVRDGEDLSVIEIGGQDAKYIRVSHGRIIESDMNKACSAGTGSFLEEQAAFYDVDDIDEVVALAHRGERPPDLGQMCTVYVADAAAAALSEGFELPDILAGFQYSIIHNYLDRVMGQRTLASTVFFQGKPASNPSLAWTLAAVTDREIVVPPNPGAMGAWGIGLCAIEQLGQEALAGTGAAGLDLDLALRAEILERSEFQCKDRRCSTLCPIEKTVIGVGGERSVALSGGACPKYEVRAGSFDKIAKEAPDPFAQRQELLDRYDGLPGKPGQRAVAIPQVGPVGGYIPYLATFCAELGYPVTLLKPDPKSLARGEQLCNSFDSCGPAKIVHAMCDIESGPDGPALLFPKITDIHDREGPGGQACVTEQALPEIVERSLTTRGRDTLVVRPALTFASGLTKGNLLRGLQIVAELDRVLPDVDVGLRAVHAAARRAARAQEAYEAELGRIGAAALAYGRERKLPMVMVGGSLHVIHDPAINARIPQLLRQNGALPIPADCYPIGGDTPELFKIYWGDSNRMLRAAAHAREAGDVYPLMLSSFGCGPASFIEHVFDSLLVGFPHTILESDGHGGAAGYVTRIQAFLQSVHQHLADSTAGAAVLPDNSDAIDLAMPRSMARKKKAKTSYLDRDARYVFLSGPNGLGPLLAAVYRSYGFEADSAPALSAEAFACGRRDCSGKECISYQMVWGAFRKYLGDHPARDGQQTRLMQVSGPMCRGGMFPHKDQLTVQRIGLDDSVTTYPIRIAGGPGMAYLIWVGVVAIDVVRQLYLYYLAVEPSAGKAQELYDRYTQAVLDVMERPVPRGWSGRAHMASQTGCLMAVLEEAALAFSRFDRLDERDGNEPTRTVFVTGDALTKGDDFAAGGLFQHLAERRIRVVMEPLADFLEFMAIYHPALLFGRNSKLANNLTYRATMTAARKAMYARLRKQLPWLPAPDTKALVERGHPIIGRETNGTASLAVGSALHHWENYSIDGLVMTACWGCDNGLIEESLLRHEREIPSYFFYDDGTPMDTRKVNSFVFGLHRRPARSSLET